MMVPADLFWKKWTLPWSRIWKTSWKQRRAAIRNPRCAGRARALATWPRNSTGKVITSAIGRWRPCCTTWITACKPTARPRKGIRIPIATPNSSTSIGRYVPSTGGPAGRVGGHEKEGIGRGFQERGPGMATRRHPRKSPGQGFPGQGAGESHPGGVYDLTFNEGWVSVGVDHNTAVFATETIRRWWREMGAPLYPDADRLLVTVDAGGAIVSVHGCGRSRCKRWPMN